MKGEELELNMQTQTIPYEKQIFVCINDRKGESPSCGDHQGEAVFKELRRIAKEKSLHPRIRVAQAKCLGQCNKGVTIMVYPEGIWHSGVRLKNVEELVEKYFK